MSLAKNIEATATGRHSVTLNDVSNVPHKITVHTTYEGSPQAWTIVEVSDGGANTETYISNEYGIIENIVSYSPNMTFTSESVNTDITVNYLKFSSVSKKLVTIAENEQKVFEAGQKSEYDKFWDIFQDYGNKQSYYYAFAYGRFTDENYNPKYPLKCSDGTTPSRYIFFNATGITDTKVEVVANSNNIESAFNGAENLVNIRKLTVYENTTFTNTFTSCLALVEIRFGGTIGQSINFKSSPRLSDESIDSIIEHLKDLTGATAKTLTVHTTVYNKIVSSGKDALITAKNWSLAKA